MKEPILFIEACDVSALTGKKQRAAQRLLAKVRKYLERWPYRPVTVEEFCTYTGAQLELVRAYVLAKQKRGRGGDV